MIYYRKKNGIRIAEIWYDRGGEPEKKSDVIKYKFAEEVREGAALREDLFTLLLDLGEDEKALHAYIGKSAKNEINRARERDGVRCGVFLELNEKSAEKLNQYIDYFNAFAASKNRSAISFSDLGQFYEAGTLCIRRALSREGSPVLAMHAYIVGDNRARLLQSASHFRESFDPEERKLIGRANRLLHWEDILYFKAMGLGWYDFGGWYGGETDREKLAINQFKETFGGKKRREYSYLLPVSGAGKIALAIQRILKRK
jgi:hypothetical protein